MDFSWISDIVETILKWVASNKEQVTAVAAIIASFISALSIFLAFCTFRMQKKHHVKSVTPVCEIVVSDYEDRLRVSVANYGIGPLIIEQIDASRNGFMKSDNSLIRLMPHTPDGLYWAQFIGDASGRALVPKDKIVLIELAGDLGDTKFCEFRDEVRNALKSITLKVRFKDIYGNRFPEKKRLLDWFGRNLTDQQISSR